MHPGKIVNVLCVGSGHRLHIPTSGTDNPGLQNLFWWVQCCFYVKNLINDLLLCTFIYICSRRSCAERTWNKEYGTFLGSLHLMHGKGKSGLITRQGCPGERDNIANQSRSLCKIKSIAIFWIHWADSDPDFLSRNTGWPKKNVP